MTLKAHYTDGTSADVTSFTTSGYRSATIGKQTVSVTHNTVTATFTVTVSNYAVQISVTTLPTKTEYYPDEPLDLSGMVVKQYYVNGVIEEITDYTVSPIDTTITGLQSITVTYGGFSTSFKINCHFPVTLESLLDNINGMTAVRNNTKNDDSTDTLTGVDWFSFNGVTTNNIYVNGNNYIGFGSSSQHLKVCNRDGAVYYVYRLEGTLTNGHRFLKLRIDGTTSYSQYTDAYRLIYELCLFDDNSMFLSLVQTPTNTSYMGASALVCGDTTQSFTISANTAPKFSFYSSDSTGTAWAVDSVCHIFLASGIEVTPPTKTQYLAGEEFDGTGMAVTMLTNAYGNIAIESYDLSGFDSSTTGTKTITVTYRTLSATFGVIVGNTLTAEIGSPNIGDVTATLDVITGELTVTGTGAIMDFTDTALFGGYISRVQSVSVSDGITSIGGMTFSGYPNCQISLPSTLESIGTKAFSGSAFTALAFGEHLTAIDSTAFENCTALTSITIDNQRDAIPNAPWGAENANVVWLQGGLYVYWLDWDETELKTELVEYKSSGTPPTEPSRSGYLFSGWDIPYKTIEADTTIHAQYNAKSIFLVKFLDYDGRNLKSEYLTLGSAAVPPQNPSREGYTFSGWDTDYGYITSDLTVTAVYTERADEYTVTFKDWNGYILKEEKVVYGHSATAPTPPMREGYYFLSWSRSFGFITADTVTTAQYRECRPRTTAEVFDGENKVGEIQKVLDCTVSRKLNGECTLSLSTLAVLSDFIAPQYKLEIDGLIFDIVGIDKQIQGGMYQTTISGEHVSYILNNEEYTIDSFDFTGSPAMCLAKLLEGTPFSVGTVDYIDSVTLKINKSGTTRRDALMQLLALCDGEIEYDGYDIGIRSHIGNSERTYLMDTLNVTDVAMSIDARSSAESYSIQLFKRVSLSVGDEINITFKPLGIDTDKRIVEISYSPFNVYRIDVTLGSYRPTLSDSLYTVSQQTSTNTADTTKLETQLNEMENTVKTLSQSANSGGFKVKSVDALPQNPDNNTIYLIRGEVTVT